MENTFNSGDRFAADTTPEAARVQIEIFSRMAPEQRLKQALELTQFTRACRRPEYADGIPNTANVQVQLAVIRLVLGDELFRIGYPNEDVAV